MDVRIKKIGVIVGARALRRRVSAGPVALAQTTLSTPSPTVTPVAAVGTPSPSASPVETTGRRTKAMGRPRHAGRGR